jgi:hypothetical protein
MYSVKRRGSKASSGGFVQGNCHDQRVGCCCVKQELHRRQTGESEKAGVETHGMVTNTHGHLRSDKL